MTILTEFRSRMRRDTHRTETGRGAEALEDLVYRPRLAASDSPVRSANPLIAVPLTLLGYLALGFLGWQIFHHSRTFPAENPKSVTVDLLDASEGEVPQATLPAPPPATGGPSPGGPSPGGPPLGAIERPDAPPPPIPVNADAVPEKQPTELPTQDLSGVAFPSQPSAGQGGAGTGAILGGSAPAGTGAGPGSKIVEFDFSQVEVKSQPKLDYPAMAYRAGIQGTVKVAITVGLDGIPISAKAFEGPPILRSPAETYAMKWQFKPSTENGIPVFANFTLTVVFRIK